MQDGGVVVCLWDVAKLRPRDSLRKRLLQIQAAKQAGSRLRAMRKGGVTAGRLEVTDRDLTEAIWKKPPSLWLRCWNRGRGCLPHEDSFCIRVLFQRKRYADENLGE